jgi:hypothetical protein
MGLLIWGDDDPAILAHLRFRANELHRWPPYTAPLALFHDGYEMYFHDFTTLWRRTAASKSSSSTQVPASASVRVGVKRKVQVQEEDEDKE